MPDWVTQKIRETVQRIKPARSQEALLDAFLMRYRIHHTRRRLKRLVGFGVATGAGVGMAGGSLLDIEWLDLFESLLNWLGKPLALKMGQLSTSVFEWFA